MANNKIDRLRIYLTSITYLILLVILLSGCASTEIVAQIDARQIDSTTDDYYLRAGDTIEIRFFITPELNTSVLIRPDGKISLELIDDVKAEGLTCEELDKVLTEEYEKQLNKTLITVVARSLDGQNVYVAGEVYSPRVIPMTGKLNALQAIFIAGGFKVDAKLSEVVIISRNPDNKPLARKVNLKKALKGKLLENEYLLSPFDIVYIPKTRLAKIHDFTAHIYSIIPNRIWRGFVYETGSSFTVDDARDRFPELE